VLTNDVLCDADDDDGPSKLVGVLVHLGLAGGELRLDQGQVQLVDP
jgi:hypothetical protein